MADSSFAFAPTLIKGTHYDQRELAEVPLYGAARLGVDKERRFLLDSLNFRRSVWNPLAEAWQTLAALDPTGAAVSDWPEVDTLRAHVLGQRRYEFNNHLGNVLAVASDRKILIDSAHTFLYYEADIYSLTDYYPFGMQMTGRTASLYLDNSTGLASLQMDFAACSTCVKVDGYRFGFQGQETDDEWKGKGNSVNYTFRMHDPRLGRFFSVDPLAPLFPHNAPYNFSENRLIDGVELEGLELAPAIARPALRGPLLRPSIAMPRAPTMPIPIPPAYPMPITPDFPGALPKPVQIKSSIDWNNPPASPAELSDQWEDISHPKAPAKHRHLRHKKTGEELRFDKGDPNKPGYEGKDHWHRVNPNKTGKHDQYLDRFGNPVAKGSKPSHIVPNTTIYLMIPELVHEQKQKYSEIESKYDNLPWWDITTWSDQLQLLEQMDEIESYIEDLEEFGKDWEEYKSQEAVFMLENGA